MRVQVHDFDRHCIGTFDLQPTEHEKGGAAWTVRKGDVVLGVLRRWDQLVVRVVASASGASAAKTTQPRWTVYMPDKKIRVFDTRKAALLHLNDLVKV